MGNAQTPNVFGHFLPCHYCYWYKRNNDTFSRPVVQNIAEGFASCSLSFNKLLPKAKYMKRPSSEQDMFDIPPTSQNRRTQLTPNVNRDGCIHFVSFDFSHDWKRGRIRRIIERPNVILIGALNIGFATTELHAVYSLAIFLSCALQPKQIPSAGARTQILEAVSIFLTKFPKPGNIRDSCKYTSLSFSKNITYYTLLLNITNKITLKEYFDF